MKLQVSYIDKLRARGRPAIYGRPSFFAMFLHSIILELRTHVKIPNVYSIISSCYRGYLTDFFIFKYFKRIFNVHHFSPIILSKCDPKGSSHKFLSCAILNFFFSNDSCVYCVLEFCYVYIKPYIEDNQGIKVLRSQLRIYFGLFFLIFDSLKSNFKKLILVFDIF